MPTAQTTLLSYEEVPNIVLTAASCGRLDKVSACRYVLGGTSPYRVNQSSVVHEHGVGASRVGER